LNSNTGIYGKQVDVGEIRRAVNTFVFLECDDVVELRLPGSTKGTISGYFDNPEKLVKAAAELSGHYGASCYFTLNKVRRDLLARSANHVTRYSRYTTKDDDILQRRWLPIDIDPIRPAGIPSTDHEHEAAISLAHKVSRELEAQGWPIARQIAKASTVAAIERLARADRRHAMTVEQWDADPWTLNTPSGIVDLRTGEISEHRREHFCTKITGSGIAHHQPDLWFAFLDRVTDGDSELQSFLCRMFGYALTGITTEHALFFLYGTGKNGKSVFISTISGIAGEYSKSAPIETFTASQTDQHPTDRASLVGARLVTAVEVEDGRRWAESKIKNLTGGDKISARFMRQDFFEFIPRFKLIIAGNHRPGLRSVDEAIRRRLHLVPFTVTIAEKQRDRDLAEKLRNEWPAILLWGIQGCLEWQAQGLNPPKRVQAATEEYFAAEDLLGRWLEERTVRGAHYETASSALYKDWKQWTEERNETTGSNKEFSQRLQDRDFGIESKRTANMFKNLALRQDTKPFGSV